MFTGLVEAVGKIRSLRPGESGAELVVEAPFDSLCLGESVAIDGVCLTVASLETPRGPQRPKAAGVGHRAFRVQATAETLARTTLGGLSVGTEVNLERSLRLGDRMGGHIVMGHVDAVGTIEASDSLGDDAVRVTFRSPADLAPLLARKGSVAVDGVSLTINGAFRTSFDVVLIPHTRKVTTLGRRRVGDPVNLEVDVVARYVLRALELGAAPGAAEGGGVTLDLLERGGFL